MLIKLNLYKQKFDLIFLGGSWASADTGSRDNTERSTSSDLEANFFGIRHFQLSHEEKEQWVRMGRHFGYEEGVFVAGNSGVTHRGERRKSMVLGSKREGKR